MGSTSRPSTHPAKRLCHAQNTDPVINTRALAGCGRRPLRRPGSDSFGGQPANRRPARAGCQQGRDGLLPARRRRQRQLRQRAPRHAQRRGQLRARARRPGHLLSQPDRAAHLDPRPRDYSFSISAWINPSEYRSDTSGGDATHNLPYP